MNKQVHDLVATYHNGDVSRREFLRRAAALGLTLPLAAALATPGAAGATPGPGNRSRLSPNQDGGVELTVGLNEEPDTLDPHNMTAAAAGLVGYVVMPGLVWWDYDLHVSPMLAESWDTSDDGLVWTFHLRPNLVFHNGKACTAQEVVRNFDHIMDPDSSFLAPDYESVASVEAPDDTTVVFTLKEPFAPFLAVLSNRCGITDMDAYDATTPIGTGPFKILEWNRGTGLKLERHDQYWEEGLPLADRVNWNFLPSADSRVLALQAGEIDIAYEVPASQISQLEDQGTVQIDPIPGVQHVYMAFNCESGPFSDVRVRKAVAHAIDKELIVEGALWGYGHVTNTPFPPTSPWFADIPDYERDPEKARALLKEAGFEDGISIDLPIQTTSPIPTVAEIIQADLAEVGIDVRIVEIEWATYWPEIYLKGQFDITIMGYSARVDPDQTFYPRYRTGGVHNATHYSNESLDDLLDQGRAITSPEERKTIYDEVQAILVDELPWLWLYLPDVTMSWSNDVIDFQQHPASHFYLTDTTRKS
ncbi:MAG TPA: ABC transporter substrate-binding protein [Thermomicrobiales bacterium]|nr:ABC transporter substrate-binding protein [Thermomicrobiales bacterium]